MVSRAEVWFTARGSWRRVRQGQLAEGAARACRAYRARPRPPWAARWRPGPVLVGAQELAPYLPRPAAWLTWPASSLPAAWPDLPRLICPAACLLPCLPPLPPACPPATCLTCLRCLRLPVRLPALPPPASVTWPARCLPPPPDLPPLPAVPPVPRGLGQGPGELPSSARPERQTTEGGCLIKDKDLAVSGHSDEAR